MPEPLFTPTTKAERRPRRDITADEAHRARRRAALPRAASAPRSRSTSSARRTRRRAASSSPTRSSSSASTPTASSSLIDEMLTPDSSRYWPADAYDAGTSPAVASTSSTCATTSRRSDWDKTPPGPELPDDVRDGTAARYLEAYERITGADFDAYLEEMGVSRMKVTVLVRPARRDPRSAGQAIDRSLQATRLPSRGVRAGKVFDLELDAADRGAAESQARELAERVLTNPLIEQFEVVVHGLARDRRRHLPRHLRRPRRAARRRGLRRRARLALAQGRRPARRRRRVPARRVLVRRLPALRRHRLAVAR